MVLSFLVSFFASFSSMHAITVANGGGRVVGAGTRPMPTGGVARKKMPTPRVRAAK